MCYRNSEGYFDPTAGKALARIMRDERKKETRNKSRKKGALKYDRTRVSQSNWHSAKSNRN